MFKLANIVQALPAAQDPLADLKDIHTPEPIGLWPGDAGFWPPAPGWWLLALFTIVALVLLIRWLYRFNVRRRYRRQALAQLQHLHILKNDAALYLQAVNIVIKGAAQRAQSAASAPSVAALSGKAWLEYLDQSSHTSHFTQGEGQVLGDTLYAAKPPSADLVIVEQLAQRWIKHHQPLERL